MQTHGWPFCVQPHQWPSGTVAAVLFPHCHCCALLVPSVRPLLLLCNYYLLWLLNITTLSNGNWIEHCLCVHSVWWSARWSTESYPFHRPHTLPFNILFKAQITGLRGKIPVSSCEIDTLSAIFLFWFSPVIAVYSTADVITAFLSSSLVFWPRGLSSKSACVHCGGSNGRYFLVFSATTATKRQSTMTFGAINYCQMKVLWFRNSVAYLCSNTAALSVQLDSLAL